MFVTGERDTLSFVAVVAVVAFVTFVKDVAVPSDR
jgi:hypothetical protein